MCNSIVTPFSSIDLKSDITWRILVAWVRSSLCPSSLYCHRVLCCSWERSGYWSGVRMQAGDHCVECMLGDLWHGGQHTRYQWQWEVPARAGKHTLAASYGLACFIKYFSMPVTQKPLCEDGQTGCAWNCTVSLIILLFRPAIINSATN